jgi:integrase
VARDGQRYTGPTTYTAKIDAEGWLSDERKLIDRGEWTPPNTREQKRPTITLRDYTKGFMAERDLTPKTRSLYNAVLDSRVLPVLGDERLGDITPALVRTWWSALGREFATPTRNAHAYTVLKIIMNQALADKIIGENPCQIKGANKPPKPRQIDLLTLKELETVTEAMPAHYRAAVPVLAWCGLRFGELIELRRKDIHFVGEGDSKRTVIRIRRAAVRVDGEMIVGPPKSDAGIRDVTVPPHVADLLTDHMKVLTKRSKDSLIFTTTRGDRLSQAAFSKQFKLKVAEVGKPDMRVHDLRHVGATLAAQAGATTAELMARIGHSTPGMAMRYQHAAQERDVAIADQLSKLAGEG